MYLESAYRDPYSFMMIKINNNKINNFSYNILSKLGLRRLKKVRLKNFTFLIVSYRKLKHFKCSYVQYILSTEYPLN